MAYYQDDAGPQAYANHQHQHHDEVSAQLSRHHDLELGLNRMAESDAGDGPVLARVVMEECREAKIRRQNKQILISVGVSIALIVAVIWFVVSR